MLSIKANTILENLKPLIEQTSNSGVFLFDLLAKCPIGKIKSDEKTNISEMRLQGCLSC